METTSPSPAKRMRSVNCLQLTECIREFKLLQQFPSMVNPTRSPAPLPPRIKNEMGLSTNSVFPKSIKLMPSKESQNMSKLKMLRIKSQDGRDLGEIKVQFLPQNGNMFKPKTVTLTKPSVLIKMDKPTIAPVFVPLEKMEKLDNDVPNLAKDLEKSKEILLSVVPILSDYASNIVRDNKMNGTSLDNLPLQKPLSVMNDNVIVMHQRNVAEKQLTSDLQRDNMPAKNMLLLNLKAQEKRSVTSHKNNIHKDIELSHHNEVPLPGVKSKGNVTATNLHTTYAEPWVKKNTSFYYDTSKLNDIGLESNTGEGKPTPHKLIAMQKCPLVNCKKLMICRKKNVNKKSVKKPKAEMIGYCEKDFERVSLTQIGAKKEMKESFWNNKQTHNTAEKLNDKVVGRKENSITNSSDNQILRQEKNLEPMQNSLRNRTKLGQNVMVIVHNKRTVVTDENLSFNTDISKNLNKTGQNASGAENSIVSRMTNKKKPINCGISSDNNVANSQSVCNVVASNDTYRTMPNYTNEDLSFQKRLSDQLDIIKEAVSSVKDEELRAKALEALANCGIGIERYVPHRPPGELRTVHDTQMQTDIFGLLDKDNFVLVKEDLPGLHRIKQNMQTACKSVMDKSCGTEAINVDNSQLKSPIASFMDDSLDLDSFFNNLCAENDKANKVKEILSKPNKLYERVCKQLKEDIETAKSWDENGLLNIHKAVMNDSIMDVQRFALVLQGCRESIDARTESGATSLELAIKCNVSEDIVKFLLKAGAQPVVNEVAHDSALHIASKMSSPLLLELIDYVKDPKLLNQMDSVGFAALHYCALFGHLEAVGALLRAGANVNLRDSRSGRTPIFHAVENKHNAITQRLLQSGAIPHIQNFSGQSVLSILEDVKNLSLRASLNEVVK
ncbi:hypothetical protein KM043_001424 [Ampulex compressa]|nr:hypothetical protein KM043_001424 [Ampulex compressa]